MCPAVVEDVYVAELMVESNVTLDSESILSVLSTPSIQVTNSLGVSHMVTFTHKEVIAGISDALYSSGVDRLNVWVPSQQATKCTMVSDELSCTCSAGYTWSNEVCYSTLTCCSEMTCTHNVLDMNPLCIPKVQVDISGMVTLAAGTWDDDKTKQIETALRDLNGFGNLSITDLRLGDSVADFEANFSVKFDTVRLQSVMTSLEASLDAVVLVSTDGLVAIQAPQSEVCYLSVPTLTCTFEEATDDAGWSIIKNDERVGLGSGTIVQLNHSCATQDYKSCTVVTMQQVTGVFAGTYECSFTIGSVTHTARAQLKVALLPDEISMTVQPLTVDCSDMPMTGSIIVDVTATIQNTTSENYLLYKFKASISCQKTPEAQYVTVTFKNAKHQEKSAHLDIPVIYAGDPFCAEETLEGDLWPKAPAGSTVVIQTCPEGTRGYKARTCDGTTWMSVFSYCVNQQLMGILTTSDNFLKGVDATLTVALAIFEGLKNSSTLFSVSFDTTADIAASIQVLKTMSEASENMVLPSDVLPDLISAASNVLNETWARVNTSVIQQMSSGYLQSLEGLVRNIKVNRSNEEGVNSQNVDLKFCSGTDCNLSVFDINVNLNKTSGVMKTVGVKNLMDKLRNNYHEMEHSSLLLSVTLEDCNDSQLGITLEFPKEKLNYTNPFCVFWNTTGGEWSDEGCLVQMADGNHTVCKCDHLTSFSVLMSGDDASDDTLDLITNVGLGLSVCSLLIFLTVEFLVWSAVVKTNLSHFRHTAMVNIAMFLLLADISFLASTSPEILSDTSCFVLAVCKHLFFMAMFCWMLVMSVMLVHQLIFVFSPLRKRVFMFLSSIVGYLCPVLIVGCSYVYCKYTSKPYHDTATCWLVFEKLLHGSIHAFLLPVGTITFANLFSMLVVIVTLVKTSVPDSSKADDKETAKGILKVVLVLTPVFGVTWVIGFFLLILDKGHPMLTVTSYAFTILNSFQGVFILLTGCFAEQKVREELLHLIMAKTKGKSDSAKNFTSTTYTKDK
ncbi:adhesion G-protein coupled receptor F3 [Aulostomus maculatus]